MRELFLQIAYGRTQSAFSENGLPVGAGLEDLGKGLRSQIGTMYGTLPKGPRYLEMAEGYVLDQALDANGEIIGYRYVSLGKMMEAIRKGVDPKEAFEKKRRDLRTLRRSGADHRPRAGSRRENEMANFEGYERRIDKINAFLAEKGIKDLDEARDICLGKGVDVAAIVRGIQPIAFENAVWAYTLGAANAIKSGVKDGRAEAAEKIGEGLQALLRPRLRRGPSARSGLGHGNTSRRCFCARRRNASASSRDTSPSRRLKAR